MPSSMKMESTAKESLGLDLKEGFKRKARDRAKPTWAALKIMASRVTFHTP
jgi:hypothetical protein